MALKNLLPTSSITPREYVRMKLKVRLFARVAIMLPAAIACVVLYRSYGGGATDEGGDPMGPNQIPFESIEIHHHRVGGRQLLSNSNSTCISFPSSADAAWQAECCASLPTKKNLKNWHAACINTEYLTGAPYIECVEYWFQTAEGCESMTGTCSLKAHCSDMSSYPGMAGVNGFQGANIIFYIWGLMYMFAGLAVVCDEYFVPALEVITEKLDVSDDVAGATLMAAGGSAPELATSIIGVFVAKSEVGFSTIVGSAVFNVLFVIGMCALFSREVLVLTGWPITRDSIYYSITLLVLAIFYQFGSEEKQIDGWEAAIMLVLYLGYVTLMKFNQTLKEWFYAKIVHKAKYKSAKVEVVSSKAKDEEGDGMDDAESAAHRHGDKDIVRLGDGKPTTSFRNRRKFDARTRATTRFRAGVLDILMRDKSVVDTLRIQAVSGIIGDVRETFDEFDINGNGYIDSDELKNVLRDLLKMEPTDDQIKEAMNDLLTDRSEKAGGNDQISFEEFEQWYQFSELRVQAEMHSVFNEMDSEKDGMIDEAEFRLVLKKLHDKERDFTEDEIAHGLELFGGDDNKITFAEFCEWYKTTILYSHKLDDSKKEAHKAADAKAAGENEEDEEGVSLWPPASIRGRIVWLILLPINGPMFFTIPDVRWGHGWERLYILTFFLAILWIGVFSVFMVWWAIIIGDLIGVPQQVMGLVVLAAGTSIPDLFTSVIVARQGHGDMAVSSSIGSNIFDITMGLPIPWALYNIIKNEPIPLSPDGKIFFSLIVLLAMLASVIITIILNKYRMTKTLGITMFVLYLVFIAQDLLRQAGVFTVNF